MAELKDLLSVLQKIDAKLGTQQKEKREEKDANIGSSHKEAISALKGALPSNLGKFAEKSFKTYSTVSRASQAFSNISQAKAFRDLTLRPSNPNPEIGTFGRGKSFLSKDNFESARSATSGKSGGLGNFFKGISNVFAGGAEASSGAEAGAGGAAVAGEGALAAAGPIGLAIAAGLLLVGVIGDVVKKMVDFGVWLVKLPWIMANFAGSMLDAQIAAGKFSAAMSAVGINKEIFETFRSMRIGNATAGSAGGLEMGYERLMNVLEPIEIFFTNVLNEFVTIALDFFTVMLEWISKIFEVLNASKGAIEHAGVATVGAISPTTGALISLYSLWRTTKDQEMKKNDPKNVGLNDLQEMKRQFGPLWIPPDQDQGKRRITLHPKATF